METQAVILQQERIDDIPLLLGMMRRMKIAEILDKHLGEHHLHQGLSKGNLALGWIAYILSESDHRKSAVQAWANGLPHTLASFFATALRPNEFSDDRLGIVLNHLAATDWDDVESDLFYSCFDVYEFPTDVFRVDATASCGYHDITPDGIMQLGHSKSARRSNTGTRPTTPPSAPMAAGCCPSASIAPCASGSARPARRLPCCWAARAAGCRRRPGPGAAGRPGRGPSSRPT